MKELIYLVFVIFVGFKNPINLQNDKKRLDFNSNLFVHLVYDK
jgi:hypothetical protein